MSKALAGADRRASWSGVAKKASQTAGTTKLHISWVCLRDRGGQGRAAGQVLSGGRRRGRRQVVARLAAKVSPAL